MATDVSPLCSLVMGEDVSNAYDLPEVGRVGSISIEVWLTAAAIVSSWVCGELAKGVDLGIEMFQMLAYLTQGGRGSTWTTEEGRPRQLQTAKLTPGCVSSWERIEAYLSLLSCMFLSSAEAMPAAGALIRASYEFSMGAIRYCYRPEGQIPRYQRQVLKGVFFSLRLLVFLMLKEVPAGSAMSK
jgi:hypothetical protein